MNPETLDLLIDAASDGLSPIEAERLREALKSAPAEDVHGTLRALDAARRALRGEDPGQDEVPAALMASLRAQASGYIAGAGTDRAPAASGSGLRLADEPDQATTRAERAGTLSRWRAYAGWVAAAAALALAGVAWWSGRGGAAASPEAVWAVIDARADTERLDFAGQTAAMQGVRGRVVWNEALQQGYMELTGLPPNTPSRTQYQLWIVDPSRAEQPVDGGVFDVPAGGGRIAFTPRLPVARPAVFAITEEKPGGVVVSKGPLLVVAARAG